MSYPRRHSSAFRVSTANLQAEQSPGHTGIPGPGSRTTGRVGGVGQSTCWGWWECSPPAAIPCRASPPLLVSAVRLRRFGRATPAGVGGNAPPPPLGKWLAGGSPAAPWLPAKKTQRWHSLLRHPCGMPQRGRLRLGCRRGPREMQAEHPAWLPARAEPPKLFGLSSSLCHKQPPWGGGNVPWLSLLCPAASLGSLSQPLQPAGLCLGPALSPKPAPKPDLQPTA